MRYFVKTTLVLLALLLLPIQAPVEAAMQPDYTFSASYYRSETGTQKHLKSASLALMIGDKRFADSAYQICAFYGRSNVAKGNKGKFSVMVDLVTDEGTETIASLKNAAVQDNFGMACELLERELKEGSVLLFWYKFKGMPKIPAEGFFSIDGTIWPDSD